MLTRIDAWGPEVDGPTAVHSGNMGDIVYALPTCRALGVRRLLLNLCCDPGLSGRQLSETAARFLAPLLLAQPWLTRVEIVRAPVQLIAGFGPAARARPAAQGLPLEMIDPAVLGVDYVLDRFRWLELRTGHLIDAHADAQGIAVNGAQAFLELSERAAPADDPPSVALSLTPRYRFHDATFFRDLLADQRVLKLGTADEAWVTAGIAGTFRSARDALELAQMIASARLFVGTPSLPYAIAEGLKVPRLIDVPAGLTNAFPLGPDGWLLPTSAGDARDLLNCVLEGGPEPTGPAHILQTARPPATASVFWDLGAAGDDDRTAWMTAGTGKPSLLARIALPAFEQTTPRRLRLDLHDLDVRPGAGVRLTRLELLDPDGERLWQLSADTLTVAGELWAADGDNGLLAPPLWDRYGLALMCGDSHVWLYLPIPPDRLERLHDGGSLVVEGHTLDATAVADRAADALCQNLEALRHTQETLAHTRAELEQVRDERNQVRDERDQVAEEAAQLRHRMAIVRRVLPWRLARACYYGLQRMRALLR